jgi:hypothetical protein
MKKLIYFVLAIAVVGVMASCGGGGASTPGAAAKMYMEAAAAGDYEKFIDGMYVDPESTPEELEDMEQQKTMLLASIEEKGTEDIEEMGGIKSIEVVSEEIAENGLATVILKVTSGNGETEEEPMKMRYDGKSWKWTLEK